MSGRQRARKAASIVVLVLAVGVMAATSPVEDERWAADSFELPERLVRPGTQAWEGEIALAEPLDRGWVERRIELTVGVVAAGPLVYVELLDGSEVVLGSALFDEVTAAEPLSVTTRCSNEACAGPVRYRITVRSGSVATRMGATLDVVFTGSKDEARTDPSVTVSDPAPVSVSPTEDLDRRIELATAQGELLAGSLVSVADGCEGAAVRLVLVASSDVPDPRRGSMLGPANAYVVGVAEPEDFDATDERLPRGTSVVPPASCDSDTGQLSFWVVLRGVEDRPASASFAVLAGSRQVEVRPGELATRSFVLAPRAGERRADRELVPLPVGPVDDGVRSELYAVAVVDELPDDLELAEVDQFEVRGLVPCDEPELCRRTLESRVFWHPEDPAAAPEPPQVAIERLLLTARV